MLTKADYDKLVLMAFESLKRDIKDCEDFTVNDYNTIVAEQEKKKQVQNNYEVNSSESKKQSNTKTEKKEVK